MTSRGTKKDGSSSDKPVRDLSRSNGAKRDERDSAKAKGTPSRLRASVPANSSSRSSRHRDTTSPQKESDKDNNKKSKERDRGKEKAREKTKEKEKDRDRAAKERDRDREKDRERARDKGREKARDKDKASDKKDKAKERDKDHKDRERTRDKDHGRTSKTERSREKEPGRDRDREKDRERRREGERKEHREKERHRDQKDGRRGKGESNAYERTLEDTKHKRLHRSQRNLSVPRDMGSFLSRSSMSLTNKDHDRDKRSKDTGWDKRESDDGKAAPLRRANSSLDRRSQVDPSPAKVPPIKASRHDHGDGYPRAPATSRGHREKEKERNTMRDRQHLRRSEMIRPSDGDRAIIRHRAEDDRAKDRDVREKDEHRKRDKEDRDRSPSRRKKEDRDRGREHKERSHENDRDPSDNHKDNHQELDDKEKIVQVPHEEDDPEQQEKRLRTGERKMKRASSRLREDFLLASIAKEAELANSTSGEETKEGSAPSNAAEEKKTDLSPQKEGLPGSRLSGKLSSFIINAGSFIGGRRSSNAAPEPGDQNASNAESSEDTPTTTTERRGSMIKMPFKLGGSFIGRRASLGVEKSPIEGLSSSGSSIPTVASAANQQPTDDEPSKGGVASVGSANAVPTRPTSTPKAAGGRGRGGVTARVSSSSDLPSGPPPPPGASPGPRRPGSRVVRDTLAPMRDSRGELVPRKTPAGARSTSSSSSSSSSGGTRQPDGDGSSADRKQQEGAKGKDKATSSAGAGQQDVLASYERLFEEVVRTEEQKASENAEAPLSRRTPRDKRARGMEDRVVAALTESIDQDLQKRLHSSDEDVLQNILASEAFVRASSSIPHREPASKPSS